MNKLPSSINSIVSQFRGNLDARVATASLTLFSLVLVAILGHNAIISQLNAWKLLPEPERLTELYFARPNNLPTTYTPGQAQTISFTIHNIEYRPLNYNYEIIEQSSNSTVGQLLATGSFSLHQDQFKTPSVKITPKDMGQRVQIEVKISNANVTISYWVARSAS